jgi:hypothetical protein
MLKSKALLWNTIILEKMFVYVLEVGLVVSFYGQ